MCTNHIFQFGTSLSLWKHLIHPFTRHLLGAAEYKLSISKLDSHKVTQIHTCKHDFSNNINIYPNDRDCHTHTIKPYLVNHRRHTEHKREGIR